MPSYTQKSIAAYQKQISDAVSGKGLKRAIEQLQKKSQIRDSLKDLPARGKITAKRQIGKPPNDGISSPLNETSRLNYDEALVYSSSGLFVFRYANIRTLNLVDAKGRPVVVNFIKQAETA